MPSTDFQPLIEAVSARRKMVQDYLFDTNTRISFTYKHLEEAVYSYVKAGGKSLRAGVMMFACGAVGGDEKTAVPAAAAVELYHTFTLVHDDIIDRDEMRRGVPTVHSDFRRRGESELHFDPETAAHYGLALAILAGDMQQGWAASLLPDLHRIHGLPAELALNLVYELFRTVQVTLINGETVDILQAETPVDKLTEVEVLEMLWQKTGILYSFAGRAGAAIGLKEPDLQAPMVERMAQFTGLCGTAFQIQDDVLGLIGNEKRLGKPVGSDIREGKRTIILLHCLPKMTSAQRNLVLKTLGNHDAPENNVQEVTEILKELGGIKHARELANTYIERALAHLDAFEESQSKSLLQLWARYIISRDL